MTNTSIPEQDDDPFLSNPRLRFMKRLVIAMGIVLIAGFITLIAAIAYRVSTGSKTGSVPAPLTGSATTPDLARAALQSNGPVSAGALPPGSQYRGAALNGSSAVLTFEDSAGFSVLIIDTETGKVTAVTRLDR